MLLWHYSRIYIFFNKPLITENEFIELIRNLLIVQSTLHIYILYFTVKQLDKSTTEYK